MSTDGHGHSHAPPDHRGRLAVVLAITSVVLVAEVVGAILSGSLALIADAGHMLSDVAGQVSGKPGIGIEIGGANGRGLAGSGRLGSGNGHGSSLF